MKRLAIESSVKPKKVKYKREKPHYGFLKALYLSFFSRKLYVDVVRRWRGYGLLYLWVMLSIMTLPFVLQIMKLYQVTVHDKLIVPLKKLPPISVRGGHVYFNSPMPYLIKNEIGDVIAAVDTEGKIKKLPYFVYPELSILITKDALHVLDMMLPSLDFLKPTQLSLLKERVHPFALDDSFDFFAANWIEDSHVERTVKWLSGVIYLALLIVFYSLCSVLFFSLSFFAQFFARFMLKVPLTFKESMRLLTVAATPEVFVYFGLLAIQCVYPHTGIFYLGFLALFFSMGVLAYRYDRTALMVQ